MLPSASSTEPLIKMPECLVGRIQEKDYYEMLSAFRSHQQRALSTALVIFLLGSYLSLSIVFGIAVSILGFSLHWTLFTKSFLKKINNNILHPKKLHASASLRDLLALSIVSMAEIGSSTSDLESVPISSSASTVAWPLDNNYPFFV